MRRSNFAYGYSPLAGGVAQSCGIGRRGSKPAHQCGSGGKGFCFAYRGVFSGKGSPWQSRRNLRILERAGKGNPPMEGDELPQEWQKKPGRKVANGRHSASKRGQRKGPLLSSGSVPRRISGPNLHPCRVPEDRSG